MRVTIFALDMGLSFAVLILYIAFIEAIAIVVLIITASVVAASRDDLTELKSGKIYVAIMILFAILVFFSVAYFSAPFSQNLFYALITLNFGLLSAYIATRLLTTRRRGVPR